MKGQAAGSFSRGGSLLLSLALPLGVVAISFSVVFIRYSTAPALVIAAYRLLLTTILIAPPALYLRRGELLALGRRDLALALLGGVFLAGHFYAWIASLALTDIAHSVLFVSLHPLFVLVASRLLFAEKIFPQALLGTLVTLVGALIVGGGGVQAGRDTLPGDLLALLGALMIAGYLLVGRHLRRHLTTLSYTTLVYGMAAFVLLGLALLTSTPLYPYPPRDYLLFAALALIPTIMGHSVFNWALERYSATLVSLLYLGEPVGAAILGWFFFREQPGAFFFPGAVLVLAGLALVVTARARS